MKTKKIHMRATREEKLDNKTGYTNIKVKIWEGDNETLSQYTIKPFSQKQIDEECTKFMTFLDNTSRKFGNGNVKNKLIGMGKNLSDLLLTPEQKRILRTINIDHLILEIDDHLVHIPWELLHLDDFFLCERFCMGRQVETSQKLVACKKRILEYPLKMWIISPSENDLTNAATEGLTVFKNINKNNFDAPYFDVDLDSDVNVEKIKENIRFYDVIHYAGHGVFNIDNPGLCGWKLAKGNLNASDINNMAGGYALPSLVFSNACQSARTNKWKNNSSFGLANAFIYSGVRHYIGTFGDIPDDLSSKFALMFYDKLASKQTIGQCLKDARLAILNEKKHTCWANYLMYGDPTEIYVKSKKNSEQETFEKEILNLSDKTIQKNDDNNDNSFISENENLINMRANGSSNNNNNNNDNDNNNNNNNDNNNNNNDNDQILESKNKLNSSVNKKKTTNNIFLISLITIIVFGFLIISYTLIKSPEQDDQWTSKLMRLAVVFNAKGNNIDKKLENMISHTVQIRLKQYSRFKIVERMDIDIIEEELKLWMSDLSSFGKKVKPDLLPAELFLIIDVQKNDDLKNKFNRSEDYSDISMRLIYNQKGESQKPHYFERIKGDLFSQRNRIAEMTVNMLNEYYPLKGKIVMKDNELVLNIGSDVGVKPGQSFKVIDQDVIFKIKGVEENYSIIKKDEKNRIYKGIKVKAINDI